jgi:hypothetical protein
VLDEMSLNLIGRMFMNWLWQNIPMIVEGTHPFIHIDLGKNKPGMTLQRLDDREWVNYKVNRKMVKSPVDIDALPPGRYRFKKEPPVVDDSWCLETVNNSV